MATKGNYVATGKTHRLHKSKTRWLRWDGIYTFRGQCNRILGDIDPQAAFDAPALQNRLRRLGYRCDDPDPMVHRLNTWHALKQFQGFTESTNDNAMSMFNRFAEPANRAQADTQIQAMLAGGLAEALQKQDSEYKSKFSHHGLMSNHTLKVRITDAPKFIDPIAEGGAFKVKMAGYNVAQSLMIRIFRNQEEMEGREKHWRGLVYQEILGPADIAALPKGKPESDALFPHHDHRTAIVREKVDPQLGVYNGMHAPYMMEIWMATTPNAFNDHVMERTEPTHDELVADITETRAHAFYVPADQLLPPDVEGPTEGELAISPTMAGAYRLFGTGCQERANDAGGQPVRHSVEFFRENTIPHYGNPFVLELTKHPRRTYDQLYQRVAVQKATHCSHDCPAFSDCQDIDNCQATEWSCPELQHTFANIRRHINLIEQQFCCGLNSNLKGDRAQGLGRGDVFSVLATCRQNLDDLAERDYPYKSCMEWIARWVDIIDFLVYRTQVQPEEKHWRSVYDGQSPLMAINKGRNNTESWRTEGGKLCQAGHPTYDENPTIQEVLQGEKLGRGDNEKCIEETLPKCEAIFIPSYNWLDYQFFVQTRPVPLYVVALADFKNFIADSVYMSPHNFFNHDLFHVVDFPKQSGQLWHTMVDAMNTMGRGTERHTVEIKAEDFYDYWNSNKARLNRELAPMKLAVGRAEAEMNTKQRELETIQEVCERAELDLQANPGDEDLEDAVALAGAQAMNARAEFVQARRAHKLLADRKTTIDSLLFTVVHEPLDSNLIKDREKRFARPVPLDPRYMRERLFFFDNQNNANGLLRGIHKRYKIGFFGRLEPHGYIPRSLIDSFQNAIDCVACQDARSAAGCHSLPNVDFFAGTGCVKGWVLKQIAAFPTFEGWFDEKYSAERLHETEEAMDRAREEMGGMTDAI